jgi:predicted MFS family arabinose efflux permease
MLPALFLGLTLVTVPLAGGRLMALAELQLARAGTLFAAIAIQVLIVVVIPGHFTEFHPFVHVATYFLVAIFLFANRGVPGLWLIGLGGAMNLAAIVANGGTMPASASALASAGLVVDTPGEFVNSGVVASPHLSFLGDIFATPSWLPFANVFSLGDIAIVLGAAVAVHRLCGSRLVPSASGEFSQLLQNRGFVRLWTGQAVANIGDFAYAVAVLVSVTQRGAGAGILVTLTIAQVAPAALVGVYGGVLADRFSRKQVMIVSDLFRFVAVASLLLVPSPSLFQFYAVAVCLGVFGSLFQPSLQASLPELVGKKLLVAANSLVTATFHIAVMIGPAIGGLLAAHVGATPAFALNAASFALSAGLILGVRMKAGPKEQTDTPKALLEGIRYSLASPLVRGILLITGLAMLAASIKSPLEPLFILRALGGQPQDLGFTEACWGLGMLIGSVAAPAMVRRWRRTNLLHMGFAMIGTCTLMASFATSLFPVLLLWIVGGAGNAFATVSFSTLLQEHTPDRLRGRVMAGSDAVLNSAIVIGALISSVMAAQIGVRSAYLVAGLMMTGTAMLGHRLLAPVARSEQIPPEAAASGAAEHTAPTGGSVPALTPPEPARG